MHDSREGNMSVPIKGALFHRGQDKKEKAAYIKLFAGYNFRSSAWSRAPLGRRIHFPPSRSQT